MLSDYPVQATIPTKDIKRAETWYAEKLGLKPSKRYPNGDLGFEAGKGSGFYVYTTQFAGTATHTLVGFQVPDVESEVAELQKKGVSFEEYDLPGLKTVNGVASIEDTKAAWFKDSDGNILSIVQEA